jgi:excisionase family DNA binding protein
VVGTATEELLSLQEAADRLGVSVYTVRRWIKDGKLRAFKPGKEYRVREPDFEEFLRTREVRPKAPRRSPSEPSFNDVLEEERRFRPNTREAKGLELFCTRVERRIDSGRMTPNEIEIAWEAIDGFVAVVAATMSDAVFKRFISLGHRILEAAKELKVREDAETRAGATRLEEWKNRRAAG